MVTFFREGIRQNVDRPWLRFTSTATGWENLFEVKTEMFKKQKKLKNPEIGDATEKYIS